MSCQSDKSLLLKPIFWPLRPLEQPQKPCMTVMLCIQTLTKWIYQNIEEFLMDFRKSLQVRCPLKLWHVKIRDLRLYYLTVQICTIYRTGFWSLANRLFCPIFFGLSFEGDFQPRHAILNSIYYGRSCNYLLNKIFSIYY